MPRLPFEQDRPLVAARPFKVSGVAFKVHDEFPWRQMAVTERRVRQMWDARMVAVAGDPTLPPKKHAAVEVEVVKAPAAKPSKRASSES